MSRLRAFLAGHARDIVYWIRKLWWVVVIVVTINSYGTWLAIDHANANAARQQRHANAERARQEHETNQKFRQAQILANHKFQQSIRVSITQSSYAQNKSVCGWRGFLRPTLTDKRIPQERRDQIAVFLESQVTVPTDFKCASLPKNPPKAKP